MRFKKLDSAAEKYLLRVYGQYLQKKLTFNEEVQLFQDLVDTGLYLQMGEETISFVRRLVSVNLIKPAVVLNYETSH